MSQNIENLINNKFLLRCWDKYCILNQPAISCFTLGRVTMTGGPSLASLIGLLHNMICSEVWHSEHSMGEGDEKPFTALGLF